MSASKSKALVSSPADLCVQVPIQRIECTLSGREKSLGGNVDEGNMLDATLSLEEGTGQQGISYSGEVT